MICDEKNARAKMKKRLSWAWGFPNQWKDKWAKAKICYVELFPCTIELKVMYYY